MKEGLGGSCTACSSTGKSSNSLRCLMKILTSRHCSMFLKSKIDSKWSVYCDIFIYFCLLSF